MLIDTHAHLSDEDFDVDCIVRDFEKDGLQKVITVGYDLASSKECVEIGKRYAGVYAAVGVHPSDSDTYCPTAEEELIRLAESKKVVAIGEIGLDYHYENTDKDVQRRVFLRQLIMANDLKLPVILHVRDAYGETLRLLQENRTLLGCGGVLHCYSGSSEMIAEFLKLGLYISFSGSVTFKNNKKANDCILAVPKERILTETDCPYLAPTPYRGQTNYPKYVRLVAEKIADVYGMSVETLCGIVEKNVRELFKI